MDMNSKEIDGLIGVKEIRELALRYIDEDECTDIPDRHNIFAIFTRPIIKKKNAKNHDWLLIEYGFLLDYITDPNEKPYGKWINMNYLSLNAFPPSRTSIRLQPPHIAKGYFQSFDRTHEMRIELAIGNIDEYGFICRSNDADHEEETGDGEAKILQFPGGKK